MFAIFLTSDSEDFQAFQSNPSAMEKIMELYNHLPSI